MEIILHGPSVAPPSTLLPRKKFSVYSKTSWWNIKCTDAIDSHRTLLRLYKAAPTLDNWILINKETFAESF